MTKVIYSIVEHDGGWAYRVDETFSETFPTREAAQEAARRAALEQRRPGETAGIEWEDERGEWHSEVAQGNDRPEADVES